ncbi:MAG TPA: 2OG-Fe(II) oxygenase [Caulobacteraceae bacterium]
MDADSRLESARRLLAAGSPRDVATAIERLRDAAALGEAPASCLLAVLAGIGIGVARDFGAAIGYLRDAAHAGSAFARDQLAVLSPDGDEDIAQVWTAPCEKRVLSASPRIVAIDGFIPLAACDWLIARASSRLSPARVYGETQKASDPGSSRTNAAFEFELFDLDMVVVMVRVRIAATVGAPEGALETSQVFNYQVGQRFAPHHDWLDPSLPAQVADIARFGQRAVTFLTYLNGDFDGGETDFPRLGLRHKGAAGGALYFGNLDAGGAGDPRTVHEGLAPTRGEKWLLSQWIRNRARV